MITITLFGTIALDFGSKKLPIDISENETTLEDVLHLLKEKFSQNFSNYFDEDFTPKRGTLILINGVDFNALDGLQTQIGSTDQINFIPTISGG